jgi:predicted dehydrogenase
MTDKQPGRSAQPHSGRRRFLTQAGLIATGVAAASELSLARSAHAAGSDQLKVGLVGCGGRGTGAAVQALRADPNVKLVALGDAFEDRLKLCLNALQRDENLAAKVDVPPERQFVGFDNYQGVIGSGIDVVLLCSPPHFRPLHLKAAVDAGLHVFAEKPVAVDAPGVRSVLATCEAAKEKKLSVVSGLCLRYSLGFKETIGRIHDGAIGELRYLQANDLRGPIWLRLREPDWTDMHWQMRNWYYFTWLSGDFNVEQHVHYLDLASWVMNGKYPVKAVGTGGRQVRTGPEFGNIYDHHAVVYEYDNGVRLLSHTRQMPGCKGDMSLQVYGGDGAAHISEKGLTIRAASAWTYDGEKNDVYQTEHDELFRSIRTGQPINNGEYMSHSTLLAIMGRMATYTGQEVTWKQALESKEDLSPPAYEWGPLPPPAIAVPGVTKLI